MKNIYAILILLALPFSLRSDCAIFPGSFVESTELEWFTENNGLIWIGEFVEEIIDQSNFTKATKFRVIEVWCGEIIPGPSTDAPDYVQQYINDDEFIWIIGSSGSSQDEYYSEGTSLFASPYWSWGYGTSACTADWLLLDDSVELIDPIVHAGTTINTLEDLKTTLSLENCESANGIDEIETYDLYPNPASEMINVPQELLLEGELEAVIYNAAGQRILAEKHLTHAAIDVSSLSEGIYFVSFLRNSGPIGNAQFVKL